MIEECYKHAQDVDEFAYNIKVWRAADMYIRRNGHFPHGASVSPGPHALCPTVIPYISIMFKYMTHIESGRSSNLNLSQFFALRFITYLLNNSHVLYRVFSISNFISSHNQSDEDDSAILSRARKLWRETSIRGYVSELNRCTLDESSLLLLPIVFGVR